MNTVKTSKTHASYADLLVRSAGCVCCPSDGSSGKGGGVGSQGPIAIAHSFGSAAARNQRGAGRADAWILACAIDDPKTPTPQGEFSILTKTINPIYVSEKSGQRKELSGPTSPIGDRYLAFHRNGRGEFGIHGTPWPHWVKTRAAVSLGCVRMLNTHVRQLFDLVDVGTILEIRG